MNKINFIVFLLLIILLLIYLIKRKQNDTFENKDNKSICLDKVDNLIKK